MRVRVRVRVSPNPKPAPRFSSAELLRGCLFVMCIVVANFFIVASVVVDVNGSGLDWIVR